MINKYRTAIYFKLNSEYRLRVEGKGFVDTNFKIKIWLLRLRIKSLYFLILSYVVTVKLECMHSHQGAERPADMLCRRYFIWIRNICLMWNYRVYNNLFWIFLIQMEYKWSLQSMYNHIVGRATSVVSPLYFILLGSHQCYVQTLSEIWFERGWCWSRMEYKES